MGVTMKEDLHAWDGNGTLTAITSTSLEKSITGGTQVIVQCNAANSHLLTRLNVGYDLSIVVLVLWKLRGDFANQDEIQIYGGTDNDIVAGIM